MKLLTKEWYRIMGDSELGSMAQADPRTAEVDEALFQSRWAEKMEEWFQLRREVCEVLEQEFDEAGERRLFEEGFRQELEHFQTRLPEKIRQKVADLRMLVLGYCTEEVLEDLKAYRQWCRKWTEKTMEEAWNMRVSHGLEKVFTGEHSLHDSFVLGLRREGEDRIIEFERDKTADWPEIQAIRFRDARILRQERNPEKSWWLYDEIWPAEEGGYEIHLLLWQDREIFELIIGCRETELIWTMPPHKD